MTYTYIDESSAYEQYNEMLDECYPNQIMDIPASEILKNCDPVAYRCGFNDWLDSSELTTELIKFRVELSEHSADDEENPVFLFDCEAEDEDHANEQAENAYPTAEILDTYEA